MEPGYVRRTVSVLRQTWMVRRCYSLNRVPDRQREWLSHLDPLTTMTELGRPLLVWNPCGQEVHPQAAKKEWQAQSSLVGGSDCRSRDNNMTGLGCMNRLEAHARACTLMHIATRVIFVLCKFGIRKYNLGQCSGLWRPKVAARQLGTPLTIDEINGGGYGPIPPTPCLLSVL